MADETLRYKVVLADVETALAKLAELKKAIVDSGNATEATAGNARTAAAADAELAKELDAVGVALQKNAAGLKDSGDKSKDAAPQLSQFGSSLSQMGGSLSQVNPQLGSLVSVGGQATSSITSLGAAMGPAGVAMGLLTTAISLGARAYQTAADDAELFHTELNHGAEQLSSYIAKLQSATEQASLFARVSAGAGSAAEQEGRVAQLSEQARHLNDIANSWLHTTGEQREAREALVGIRAQLDDAIHDATEAQRHASELATMTAALHQQQQQDTTHHEVATERSNLAHHGRYRAPRTAAGAGDDVSGFLSNDVNTGKVVDGTVEATAAANAELDKLGHDREQAKYEEQARLLAAQASYNASFTALEHEQLEVQRKTAAEVGGIMQHSGQLALSTGQQFANGIGAATVAAIEHKKSFGDAMKEMTRATLESLTQQSIGQAIWETALGIADLAAFIGSFGAAAPKAASSAAHFAAAAEFGVIAGIAGGSLAAMGPAASGGGASAGSGASRPSQFDNRPPSDGGGTSVAPIVINLGVLSGEDGGEAGRRIVQHINAAERIDGQIFARP